MTAQEVKREWRARVVPQVLQSGELRFQNLVPPLPRRVARAARWRGRDRLSSALQVFERRYGAIHPRQANHPGCANRSIPEIWTWYRRSSGGPLLPHGPIARLTRALEAFA